MEWLLHKEVFGLTRARDDLPFGVRSSFLKACQKGHLRVAKTVWAHCPPHIRKRWLTKRYPSECFSTLLHHAASTDRGVVEWILSEEVGGAFLVMVPMMLGDIPLVIACERGHLNAAKAMWCRIRQKDIDRIFHAAIRDVDHFSYSLLHKAAFTDHGLVEWLLSDDVLGDRLLRHSGVDGLGRTLSLACGRGNLNAAKTIWCRISEEWRNQLRRKYGEKLSCLQSDDRAGKIECLGMFASPAEADQSINVTPTVEV